MVLATNCAENLDTVILGRCNETYLFPHLNAECRFDFQVHYFHVLVRNMELNHGRENRTLSHHLKRLFVITQEEEFWVNIYRDFMNTE